MGSPIPSRPNQSVAVESYMLVAPDLATYTQSDNRAARRTKILNGFLRDLSVLDGDRGRPTASFAKFHVAVDNGIVQFDDLIGELSKLTDEFGAAYAQKHEDFKGRALRLLTTRKQHVYYYDDGRISWCSIEFAVGWTSDADTAPRPWVMTQKIGNSELRAFVRIGVRHDMELDDPIPAPG